MKRNWSLIRRTPFILLARFFWLEVLMALGYWFFGSLVDWLTVERLWREVVFVLFTVAEMGVVLWLTLRWAGEQFVVGDEELVHRKGIFAITEESISLKNVQAVSMSQSFWGRVFNYGTVKFLSPVLKQEYYIAEVPEPTVVKKLIESSTGGFSESHVKQSGEMLIPIRNTK